MGRIIASAVSRVLQDPALRSTSIRTLSEPSLLGLGHTAIDEQLDLGDVAGVVAAREGGSRNG